jgi:hypothetical protein
MDIDVEIVQGNNKRRHADAKSMKIPKAHRITAKQVNSISHCNQTSRRRERRLAQNEEAKVALQGLSRPEHVLGDCQSLQEIEQARAYQRAAGSALKRFERSKVQVRDHRNQRLRTKRAWSKLGANERSYVRSHARQMNIKEARVEAEVDPEEMAAAGSLSYICGHNNLTE